MLLRIACFLICASFSVVQASEPPKLDIAFVKELAKDPMWIKLGHYEANAASESGFVGAINSKKFYVSDNGKVSPFSELRETIASFYSEELDENLHTQCQFPARYLWLKKRLLNRVALPKNIYCSEFDEWSENGTFKSISVTYVTGYLGNPTSFYGHTFLKFNSKNDKSYSLDKTINYGAVVPDSENPITYIYKGIFGGYAGGFSEIGYYFHKNNYGDNELRDMWEYELNISAEDANFIAAHAWEILKKEYTYFFFRKNCAYRMAELVELANDVEIINSKPVTIPQSLITAIYNAKVGGEPLVKSVVYHPSRQSKLYEKYLALSFNEKNLVHTIVNDHRQLAAEQYKKRTVESKHRIVDTLLDYLQYARTPDERANNVVSPFYRKVLVERYRLPLGNNEIKERVAFPPHQGRSPSLIQVGITHNSVYGEGYVIALRPAYYDVLDADKSHVADSVLSMGRIEVLARPNSLELRRLSFIDLESVNSAVTGLPGDNGNSWRIQAMLEPLDLSCQDCLTLKVKAYYGYSKRISSGLLFGGYLGGFVQDNVSRNGNLGVASRIFSNISTSRYFSANIYMESLKSIDKNIESYNKYGFELRKRISDDSDVRLSYINDRAEEISINLGYYF
ncbi:DUF4105 domain-containing protein [Neptunomonas sp.]|uniref:Lnb N-terminal periplasmic domain-containing protein n=1 Tax=Neptunomonas sp. TaxID=1971898 RepID=UPI003564013F